MPNDLDPIALDHLASLARLMLSDASRARLSTDLAGMLHTLDQLSTSDDVAGDHDQAALMAPSDRRLRPDEVTPSLARDDVLANAPQRLGDGFAVPAMIVSSPASDEQQR